MDFSSCLLKSYSLASISAHQRFERKNREIGKVENRETLWRPVYVRGNSHDRCFRCDLSWNSRNRWFPFPNFPISQFPDFPNYAFQTCPGFVLTVAIALRVSMMQGAHSANSP